MVKSSIFKNTYIILVMLKFYLKTQYTKSVCIPDLVIIKYFGNNTTEIK